MFISVKLCFCLYFIFVHSHVIHSEDLMLYFKSLNYTVQLQSRSSYDEFIKGGDVKVVYFYTKAQPRLSHFLVEMEKSAGVMQIYNTKFAIINCTMETSDLGYCSSAESPEKVYIFRNGYMVLDVGVNTMFDTNSIISNVLQVMLLHEAPICQSVEEKQNILTHNKGRFDVVFSYQIALGTIGHRLLMEIVYDYHQVYKFAVTNNKVTVETLPGFNEGDKSAIWILKCKATKEQSRNDCPAFKYNGPMDRENLIQFFRSIELPLVHFAEKKDKLDKYDSNGLPAILIFFDTSVREKATMISEQVLKTYLGLVGIIMINVNEVEVAQEYSSDRKLPAVAFKPLGETNLEFMDSMANDPDNFVMQQLRINKPSSDSTNSARTSLKAELDSSIAMKMKVTDDELATYDDGRNKTAQDDQVAKIINLLKRNPINRTHLPSLMDKTFPDEVTKGRPRMILFYAPFDSRNQMILRLFAKAAEELAEKNLFPLATVDCHDWTDVCRSANVSIYPSVKIYLNGVTDSFLYTGSLSTSAILNAAILIHHESPQTLTTKDEFERFVSERQQVVTGAFSSSAKTDIEIFKMVAKKFGGQIQFALVFNSLAENLCAKYDNQVPCVLVHNPRGSSFSFAELYPAGSDADDLSRNIQNKFVLSPKFIELTVNNFPELLSLKKPFVILFTSNISSDLFDAINKIVEKETKSELPSNLADSVIFSWMNRSSPDATSEIILQHYVAVPKLNELLVINHQKGTVHRLSDDVDLKDLAAWLEEVQTGSVHAYDRLSEEKWKPNVIAIDFLEKINSEGYRNGLPRADRRFRIEHANEHGIGVFDEDQPMDMMTETSTPTESNEFLQHNIEQEIQMELEELRSSRIFRHRGARQNEKQNDIHKQHEEL